MQIIRGAVFLSVVLIFSGCETPFPSNGAADSDTRSGIKPANGGRSDLDSDNVFLGPKKRPSSADTEYIQQPPPRETPEVAPRVTLKSFRSSQPIAPQPTPTPRPKPKATPSPTPKAKKSPTPKPKPTPAKIDEAPSHEDAPTTENTPSAPAEKAPFGVPVPGKKGYVTSPYSPGAGLIDVKGLEPGTEATDPYSGKVFRVP